MIFIARFMNSFLHQASFATGYWCYDRHRSVRLVVLVGLAIDQIAQSGLSFLSVIYYSAQLFSEGFTKLAPSAVVIIGYGIAFYFLSLVLKSIPVGVAYAVWSGLGVVIITAIAWLLHGQKLDAWGFVGMGLIIAAFLLARSPSWKSLRRPTPW